MNWYSATTSYNVDTVTMRSMERQDQPRNLFAPAWWISTVSCLLMGAAVAASTVITFYPAHPIKRPAAISGAHRPAAHIKVGSIATGTATTRPAAKTSALGLATSLAGVPQSQFVWVCGTSLCANGAPFTIRGATAYGAYSDPAGEVALAQAGHLNTLELVEFDTQFHVLSDTMSEATWSRVDRFIEMAHNAGLHVVLNLSEYGQSLQAAGQTATTTDWGPYLSFIANRTNTRTGIQYKNDPTIAMVELFGEICYPGEVDGTCPAGTSGTSTDMLNFFHRSETEWHSLAPDILVSSGGFSHLDFNSNIPWQSIVSDPANAVCDVEINSPGDLSGTIGKFTSYCKSIGKPWFLAAWSSCFNSASYPFHTPNDASMAQHAADMYRVAQGGSPAAYPSAGTDFWNLRDEGTPTGTCSLSPSFPISWGVVQSDVP